MKGGVRDLGGITMVIPLLGAKRNCLTLSRRFMAYADFKGGHRLGGQRWVFGDSADYLFRSNPDWSTHKLVWVLPRRFAWHHFFF